MWHNQSVTSAPLSLVITSPVSWVWPYLDWLSDHIEKPPQQPQHGFGNSSIPYWSVDVASLPVIDTLFFVIFSIICLKASAYDLSSAKSRLSCIFSEGKKFGLKLHLYWGAGSERILASSRAKPLAFYDWFCPKKVRDAIRCRSSVHFTHSRGQYRFRCDRELIWAARLWLLVGIVQ